MGLTAELYEKYKPIADGKTPPPAGMRPEYVEKLKTAVREYESSGPELGDVQVMQPARAPTQTPEQAQMTSVVQQLDPRFSLPAQGLAAQPATTHPDSDQAAADEWVRGDLSNPNGTVVVYDMPLAELRKKLYQDPTLIKALGFEHLPPSPESVQLLDDNDRIFKDAQEYYWRQTADGLAKSGKTAYRYSKAPWMHGEGMGDKLQSLGLKASSAIAPAAEGAVAFVMGVDDMATFGVGRRAGEALDTAIHPEGQGPTPEGTAGGIASVEGASPTEVNDMIREEYPTATLAGQVAGLVPGLVKKGVAKAAGLVSESAEQGIKALRPWSASNAIFETIANYANKAATRVGLGGAGARGLAGSVAGGALGGAAAGVGTQAAQEAVNAVGNQLQFGDTGTTLDEATGRVVDAASLPGMLGAAGGLAQGLSRAGAQWVRRGEAYEGRPGRLEDLGGRFQFGRGPVSPELDAAAQRARTVTPGGVPTVDVLAKDLAPKVEAAADDLVRKEIHDIGARTKSFMSSPEGQELLPAERYVDKNLELLRETYSAERGGKPLRPVGTPSGGKTLKGLFNINTSEVSLEPSKGARAIDVDEAAAFLDRKRLNELMKAPAPRRAPPGGPQEPFAREATGGVAANRVQPVEGPTTPAPGPTPDKRGIGDWRDPRPIGDPGPITPDRSIDARGVIRETPKGTPPANVPPPVRPQSGKRFEIWEPGKPDAKATYDNWLRSRDIRKAYENQDLPPRGNEPVRPLSEQRPGGPAKPELRGNRERALGTPPPAFTPNVIPPEPAPPKAAAPKASKATPPKGKKGVARTLTEDAEKARDFVDDMRAKGVEKVYVTPRAYNAQHHERALKLLHRVGKDNINDRDIGELEKALFEDRDARKLGGVPGGWSAMQGQHQERIRSVKDTEARAAPKGETKTPGGRSFPKLIQRARQQEGEIEDVQAIERVAQHGGFLPEFQRLRLNEPYQELRNQASWGPVAGKRRGFWSPSAAQDAAVLRLGYPVIRELEGPLGPIGMGMAGRAGLAGEDEEVKKRRAKRDEPDREAYTRRREEQREQLQKSAKRSQRKARQ